MFIDWLNEDNHFTKNMILYQISVLMSIEILEDETKSMILEIALHVVDTQPSVFFEYMSNIKPELEKLEEKVAMSNVVMKSFELSYAITTNPLYSQENIYKVRMDKRLESLQLESISKLDIMSDNTVSDELQNELFIKGIKRRRYYIKILNKIVQSIERN